MVTGDVVAKSLVAYAEQLTGTRPSVSVDVPVLETDGSLCTHNLLLGPASEFSVEEVAASEAWAQVSADDERAMFAAPELPSIGIVGQVESLADAEKDAANFNEAVADVEENLS